MQNTASSNRVDSDCRIPLKARKGADEMRADDFEFATFTTIIRK